MKRSDMLLQIMQLLVLCKANDLGYLETSHEVLALIEERGMNPPSITSDGEILNIRYNTVWENES